VIRIATVDDIDAIAALGDAYWRETTAAGRYPFDIEACKTFVKTRIEDPDFLALVAVSAGTVVGALLAIMHVPWLAPERWKSAQILMWAATPGLRGRGIGVRLLHRFSEWGTERGACILGGGAGLKDGTAAHDIMQRLGWRYLETSYYKELW